MSVGKGRLRDYLEHVEEAIARIERYIDDMDEHAFLKNVLVQDAAIRNFEIIGEASRNISRRYPDFAAAHPDVPLAFAWEMRNALAHGYFEVDLAIVWRTIQRDLPPLKVQVQDLLEALDDPTRPSREVGSGGRKNRPEDLPLEEPIREVKKRLRSQTKPSLPKESS